MSDNAVDQRTHSVIVLVLAVLFGWVGADRFANRQIGLGILKLVTLGGFGIWWLVDIVIFGINTAAIYREPKATATPAATPAVRNGAEAYASRSVAPRTDRREHTPPVPRGEAITPWVTASRTVPVAGEFFRQATYEKLLQGLPRTGEWLNLDVEADLYPDPQNPYSKTGSAVSVWINGLHAGFLEDANAVRYTALLRDLAENHGQYLRVPARVSGNYQSHRGRWNVQAQLGLPEPEDVLPRNQIPDEPIELIPSGRVIQVTGEDQHMDRLKYLVEPGRAASYAATLRVIHEIRPRSAYETVEVQIDGERVGVLSKVTGEQVAPLVALIEGAGRTPVVRATVEGNELRAEVKLRMIRAAEAEQAWIQELRAAQTGPRTPTNPRGDEFDWDDEEREA